MLATKSKIDTTNPLTIELFKKMLPWALIVQLIKLKTPLKTINNWYKWAAILDHKHHKLSQAIERTQGILNKEKTPQKKYYFPHRQRDPNAMDIDRLTVDKKNKLMREGSVKQKRWPDRGLNPGPSRHIPDALTTELSGLTRQVFLTC
jgi:hypothetical protein